MNYTLCKWQPYFKINDLSDCCLIPMTDVPEIGAENLYQKTGTKIDHCAIHYWKLVPELFGTKLHVRRSRNQCTSFWHQFLVCVTWALKWSDCLWCGFYGNLHRVVNDADKIKSPSVVKGVEIPGMLLRWYFAKEDFEDCGKVGCRMFKELLLSISEVCLTIIYFL